jgi:arginine decarboxylase
VPLGEIKRVLLAFRRAGKLDRVKLLMMTNCTFDGIIYDVERVMEECPAIKPDLAFLWDEAWFAFARFHRVYRERTAMASAEKLLARFRDPDFRGRHAAFAEEIERSSPDDDALLDRRLIPDPERARVRVYATQSTHKTLTSLQAGVDDPRLRPGLQPAGRRELPRGIHGAHVDFSELPDPCVARHRSATSGAGGL